MPQSLTIIGLTIIMIGIILVVLGLLLLNKIRIENGREGRGYAVFLIGPLPIILRGGRKLAIISIVIFAFLILLLLLLIRGVA